MNHKVSFSWGVLTQLALNARRVNSVSNEPDFRCCCRRLQYANFVSKLCVTHEEILVTLFVSFDYDVWNFDDKAIEWPHLRAFRYLQFTC